MTPEPAYSKLLWYRILFFPLTRILAGVLVVAGLVFLVNELSSLGSFHAWLSGEWNDYITGFLEILVALMGYILLYRFYEGRSIRELSLGSLWRYGSAGLFSGLGLQTLAVGIAYLAGGYILVHVNPVSYVLPSLIQALVAGFVAEILLRGILFRLTEEKLGTGLAILIIMLVFGIVHAVSPGASVLSVGSTMIQAGLLYSLVYVYSRSLWFPIFLHLAWDMAEPGIFGGANPGITSDRTWFSSMFRGPALWTGGADGPGHSLQAALLCLLAALWFFYQARRKGRFIRPFWKA